LTAGRIGPTVRPTMHSWVALARWAHLTLALGILLVVAPPAIGQQPTTHPAAVSIIEFAPKSGPVGTTVTIYGTGLSSTPSENPVTFNGTLAQVISATSTEIVTTVPAGTATGLISVTTALGAATSSEAFTVGTPGEPTLPGFRPTVGEPETAVTITGTNFEDGEAEPGDRGRRLDNPDAGPLMTGFIATVAVLQIAVSLQVILRTYGSGLTPQNCRVIIGVFANALMRRLWSMSERENDQRAKWKQTKQCEVEAGDTIMMLKRCFEAQYRSLQPNLRALLELHGADLPFITNPIPPRIVPCVTALWWTDDLMVRKEQRIFMMVKEDVFLR
jgi:IPT/TIG domain